jgi:predicted transcriptional regulator
MEAKGLTKAEEQLMQVLWKKQRALTNATHIKLNLFIRLFV